VSTNYSFSGIELIREKQSNFCLFIQGTNSTFSFFVLAIMKIRQTCSTFDVPRLPVLETVESLNFHGTLDIVGDVVVEKI
jgi:hypothetical protein